MNLSGISISTQNHQFLYFRHALHCALEGSLASTFKSVRYAHAHIQRGGRHPTNAGMAWQLQTWSNYKDGWQRSRSVRTSILQDSWNRYDSYRVFREARGSVASVARSRGERARRFAPRARANRISMTTVMFAHTALLLRARLYC